MYLDTIKHTEPCNPANSKRFLAEVLELMGWYPSDNLPALILEQVKLIPKPRVFHKAPAGWLAMREYNRKKAEEKLLTEGEV